MNTTWVGWQCGGLAVIGIGDIVRLGLPVAQIAARLLTPSRATSAASKSSARRLRRVRIGAMHLRDKITWVADFPVGARLMRQAGRAEHARRPQP
jgi:hypothetical protein